MTEVVVDASVAARWLEPSGSPLTAPAQALLEDYESGRLSVVVPSLLFVELMNVAGRQWRWAEAALSELATRLETMFTDVVDPQLSRIALWTARGLTAYDATYVALAEEREVRLVTDDRQVLALAGGIAQPTTRR
jgi:predicted nucleic acid-binding protein